MAVDCLKMKKSCEDLQQENDELHARLEQKTKLVGQARGSEAVDGATVFRVGLRQSVLLCYVSITCCRNRSA